MEIQSETDCLVNSPLDILKFLFFHNLEVFLFIYFFLQWNIPKTAVKVLCILAAFWTFLLVGSVDEMKIKAYWEK